MRRLATVALLALGSLAGCRQDMHDTPRYEPLEASRTYPQGRGSLLPVENTVARGFLREDAYLHTGKQGNANGNALPFPLTAEVLNRGEQRYNVYCAPCHSRVGDGNGMIVLRGYRRPPSLHEERLRNEALGHFVDVMMNGFGAMPDYAQQVTPHDRWAIAAYIRALQLSQAGTVNDVPADMRDKIHRMTELQRNRAMDSHTQEYMPMQGSEAKREQRRGNEPKPGEGKKNEPH